LIMRMCHFKRCCQGKKLHGVCTGLAKGMNIRPFWVRLGFIITTVYGIGLYLTCWMFLPVEN
jgi:phage shock protein PspC (stress-responsive transcriptional regulator)